MTNRNKTQSRIDGKMFIRQALSLEAQVLAKKLEQSCYSITHDGVMGEVNEQHFIEVLRRYLPRRYNVSRGIVIDSQGSTSDQIDIVIYDPQYTPTIHTHNTRPTGSSLCAGRSGICRAGGETRDQ